MNSSKQSGKTNYISTSVFGRVMFMLLIVVAMWGGKVKAQVSPEEIKASLIIHFCDNIDWPSPLKGDFIIGCYTDDESVYQVLSNATKIVKVQGKTILVKRLNSLDDLEGCHALYYQRSYTSDLITFFKIARETNILLITDNYDDQLFVMVNIVDEVDRIGFRVNMANLTLAGFNVKANILLNGGRVVDIKKAYERFEQHLKDSRTRYERITQELARKESLLQQKDDIIQQKETEIDQYKNDIDSYTQELSALNSQIHIEQKLLDQKAEELNQKDGELDIIYADIEKKLDELAELRQNIDRLRSESDTLKTEIGQKNVVLNQQQVSLSNQRRYLMLLLGLATTLLIAAFALTSLFLLKKKHNRELEEKVVMRTKELQVKNEQYLSLFNLAPVSIWEVDFTAVKELIDSKELKDEKEYDRYVHQNPDFTIACFRKINFININSASLELYRVHSVDELAAFYEELYQAGALAGLENEFKALFQNKKRSNYEAIRMDKNGKRLDVLITWLDVSENNNAYSRVLLTMTDVTRLRKIESELRQHQENLEELVKERTDEIGTLNEELRIQNEQLYEANEELKTTNEELTEQKKMLDSALLELKQTQMQMIQSEKMASLGILTSGIAHEINNPLNFIQTGLYALELAIEEASVPKELVEDLQSIIEKMSIGIKRSSAIVKSLNMFSRKDSHVIRRCDIHEIIDNTLLILNHEIKGKCEVQKYFTEKSFVLEGNDENLHQVFLNIIMNSIQAIQSAGTLTILTEVKSNDKLEIRISDTGKGISKKILDRIYDPFFTTKAPGEGVGMGLSIVYKIIKEHRGTIQYFSELNKGTDVIITLPINNKS